MAEERKRDGDFFISFGLIISVRHADVEKVRGAAEVAGGKIAFQTTSTAPLYLLRHYQVEEILQGDLSNLREIHRKKQMQRRVEIRK